MVGGDGGGGGGGLCKLSSVHFYKRVEEERWTMSTTLFASLITTFDNKPSL